MKVKLIIIWFILFIVACENQDKEFVILETHELDYYTDEEVDNPAIFGDDNEWRQDNKALLEIAEAIRSKHSDYPQKISLYVRVFVDEEGQIDFIKNMKRPEPGTKKIVNELLFGIGEFYNSKNILPAVKEGEKVKYMREIKIGIELISDSLMLFIPDFIGKMEDFNPYTFNKENFLLQVEEMPSPIGGMRAIAMNVKYPEIAKQNGIQGRVFVKAFIDEEGNVMKAEVIKGIGSGCDQAAINAIKATRFTPGKMGGKPVKVQVSIPIMFKLN